MRKARTEVVIEGEGDACAFSESVGQTTQLFLVSSFRDALYLSLEGSVRMLPLLPNSRVLDWVIPIQEDKGEGNGRGEGWWDFSRTVDWE